MRQKLFTLLILAVLLCGSAAFAENINIYNTGDTPYEIDCDQAASQGGTSIFLYDDGGTGDYQTNQSYTMTLHSNNGGYVALYFQQFNLAEGTFMSIRNDVTEEMLVSNATGTELRNQTITASNGSITIIWNSGATTGDGFMARVYCGHQCQRFATNISVNGIEPTTIGGETYYDVYSGGDVQFHAENDFYENGNNDYTQTDANVTYDWAIINSTQDTNRLSGQNPTYTFNENGYYSLICIVRDPQECYNQNLNKINIRVCTEPSWMDTTAVCGNITMVNAGISGYSEFTWHAEESGSTVGTFEDEHSPILAYTAGDYGVVKFYYDANIGGNIVSDTLYIEFFAELTTTAGVDTACGHTAELQVFNANPDYEGRWSAYDLNNNVLPTVIYHDYSDPTSASSDSYPHCYVTVPIPDGVVEVEYIFRWTEGVIDPRIPESCVGPLEKHIIFRKLPVVSVHQCSSLGNSMSVCGNTVELCGDSQSSDYANFSWICNDIEGSFSNPTEYYTIFTLDSTVQISRYRDVDFLFTATIGDCSAIDTMHVRFMQKPVANAGLDHVACSNSYELHGDWGFPPSDDYTPTCQWTVGTKPNPYAQVIWANYPHDSIVEHIQVSDYGIYTFIVRETNTAGNASTCYDSDTVTIEFMERPNVRAGEDFDVCGFDFQLNAVSSHGEDDNISGTWTSMSGGTATFTDRTDPNTTGRYSAYGPARFRWTETNHPSIETDDEETCSAYDEVVVTFYEKPSASLNMNEGDTIACGLVTPFYLRAEEPSDGVSGYWYEENQSTVFGSGSNNIVTNATVSSYGHHDFYWIEYTGPVYNPSFCSDTAGPWTINFIQQPDAQIAEEEMTFCGYNGQIHADFDGVGEGQWSTNVPDIVTFNETTNPNTMVQTTVQNSGNSQYPYYELYWTVRNTESCTDKDTIKAIFARIPSDSIVVIPPMCFGEPAILTAYEDSLAIYDWEFGNGFIDSVIVNAVNGEFRVLVHWENREESHIVGLTTTNHWGCQSNIGRAIIEEPDLPEYDYNIVSDTCALGKGGIEFLDTTGLYAFFWIDTTAGPTITNPSTGYAITDSHVYNLPAGIYTLRTEHQTFNRDYMETYQVWYGTTKCYDFPMVEINTTGIIEAEIAVSAGSVFETSENIIFVNNSNYGNIDNNICEWHFNDNIVESNCDEYVGHTYTEPGYYEPYLIVMNGNIPECRDTAYLDFGLYIECVIRSEIDTIVNNYIQFNGHTFYTDGTYVLENYLDNDCRSIVTINYSIQNGIDSFYADSISIFPNPTSDILNITSPSTILKVEIFSIDGRIIGSYDTNGSDVECDVSGFVEGVYYARIYGTDGCLCSVKKFVIE